MGGDTVLSPASSIDDFNEITLDERGMDNNGYARVVKSYDELKRRVGNLEVDKSKILSYTPGAWVENVGGMTVSDYKVPQTTTLLLVGPKGSGKSSLINRISRVFEDDKFAPERAQVTYNSSTADGTCFLREYMIPRSSTSFCLYDTRSFSNEIYENLEMISRWMKKGVRHGKLVKSASENPNFQVRMKPKSRQDKLLSYKKRRVNFFIFVVNGLSVLKCMNSNGSDTQYTQMVANVFSSPFLSFKDQKPVVAITHGDLLSLSERARVRVYLGELLGVHPSKQTFDIPDNCEPTTELAIVDMVRYALEHADRNLPRKSRPTTSKGSNSQVWTIFLLLLAVAMFIFASDLYGFRSLKVYPENVFEPGPGKNKVMDVQPESVPKPSAGINKVMEVQPENVPGPNLEIMKVMVQPEFVNEPSPEVKKVTDVPQESVSELILEIEEGMNVHSEIVLEPSPETKKKVMEVQSKVVLEPRSGVKRVMDISTETFPEPNLELKHVIVVQPKSIPEPSLEKKKVQGKRVSRGKKIKNVLAGRVPEPVMEIDWKKIRHLW